jgi:hypothetical protein
MAIDCYKYTAALSDAHLEDGGDRADKHRSDCNVE